jgi:hypothetical protein
MMTLVWDDVNFKTQRLNIERAAKRAIKHDDDWNVISRGVEIGGTKSDAGNRSIPMPDVVLTALQDWKHYCEQKGIGTMRTYSSLRSLFRRFIIKY